MMPYSQGRTEGCRGYNAPS